ncbi:MAG: hypothetical protein D6765_15970, partial [Bacteroidetes bacterium]
LEPPAHPVESLLRLEGVFWDEHRDRKLAAPLVALYQPATADVDWTRADTTGLVRAAFRDFEGERLFQILNILRLQAPFEPVYPNFTLTPPPPQRPLIPHREALETYRALHRKRRLLQRYFYPQEAESAEIPPPPPDWQPDRSYRVEEFVAFKTVREFLEEVVPAVKFRKRKERLELRLLDETRTRFEAAPLVLVNGFILASYDDLLEMPPETFERIEVFKDNGKLRRRFSALGKNGVLAFWTDRALDLPAMNLLHFRGFQPLELPTPPTPQPHSPDLRPLIYWNPAVEIGADGAAEIRFPHSHDAGTFRVLVEGVDGRGNPVRGETTYRVAMQ